MAGLYNKYIKKFNLSSNYWYNETVPIPKYSFKLQNYYYYTYISVIGRVS